MSAKEADSAISELATYFLRRDPWESWTPLVDQNGNVARTVNHARYVVLGNTVHIRANLSITGAGVANNTITIGGLPSAIAPSLLSGIVGTIMILDSGTAYYVGALVISGASTFVGRAHGLGNNIGITPNFALANGDVIDIVGTWER